MQSTAAQFIQVRVHLVFLLSQIERPRLQPFCHWCGCCSAEERGPGSRSCPRQGLDNDVAYLGTCEDQLRNPQTAEVCFSVSHAGRDSSSGAKFSRIDYCNVAFASLPQRSIIRLQAVINAAARLILRVKKFDHISTLLRDELQWLRICERIKFKLSILVYNCLNNSAPPYLADKIRPLSDDCNRSRLRSSKSSDVFVPRTKTKMGDRAFEVAGPRTWNSLPATIRETKTLPAFKKQLKLYLIGNPEY